MFICEWCNKEYEPKITVDNRFCSDDCRETYHRERRKALRAIETLRKKFVALRDVVQTDNYLSHEMLRELDKVGLSYVFEVNCSWQCRECGQKRYTKPLENDHCSFCQSTDFRRVIEDLANKA